MNKLKKIALVITSINKPNKVIKKYYTLSNKNNVNFILSLFFLLPVCFVVGFYSIELIEMSWKIREVSTEAGGLAYVYIQKTLIILFPLTMMLTFAYQLSNKKWK